MSLFSINIDLKLQELAQQLISWQPNSIYRKARELSHDPKQAAPYYLTYLRRMEVRRDVPEIAHAVTYLCNHWLAQKSIMIEDLQLDGSAKCEGDSVVLGSYANKNQWSAIVLKETVGKNLFWGLRHVATLDQGTEIKTQLADMIFAINTEDFPGKIKTRIFRWDKQRRISGQTVQEANLYFAVRGRPFVTTLFLWDKDVWYIADDNTVVFAFKLTELDRENWRMAKPVLSTWNSQVRFRNIRVVKTPK